MDLNDFYTESEVKDLLGISLYDLKKQRQKLNMQKVGRKYWYEKSSVHSWAEENLQDKSRYEQVRRRIDSQSLEISTKDWIPVDKVYDVWPYSRERLSQIARTSQGRKPIVSRLKANSHWFYSKDSIRRWLLEHADKVREGQ